MPRIVAAISALLMSAFGLFWMFAWLLGSNGYSEAKGTKLLVGNAFVVLLAVVASSIASGLIASVLRRRTTWPSLLVAPLSIVAACAMAIIAMFVVSLLIVGMVGTTH